MNTLDNIRKWVKKKLELVYGIDELVSILLRKSNIKNYRGEILIKLEEKNNKYLLNYFTDKTIKAEISKSELLDVLKELSVFFDGNYNLTWALFYVKNYTGHFYVECAYLKFPKQQYIIKNYNIFS